MPSSDKTLDGNTFSFKKMESESPRLSGSPNKEGSGTKRSTRHCDLKLTDDEIKKSYFIKWRNLYHESKEREARAE